MCILHSIETPGYYKPHFLAVKCYSHKRPCYTVKWFYFKVIIPSRFFLLHLARNAIPSRIYVSIGQ